MKSMRFPVSEAFKTSARLRFSDETSMSIIIVKYTGTNTDKICEQPKLKFLTNLNIKSLNYLKKKIPVFAQLSYFKRGES